MHTDVDGTSAEQDDYRIRPFEPGDEDDFVDLYNDAWSTEKTVDWFDWRYRENPAVDHVSMFVVEHDGRVVSLRPFIPYRVRVGDDTRLAFLQTDTITHPDHRRKGLFSRATKATLAHYAGSDESPAFYFGHSNPSSRPGYVKMGWEFVSPQRTFYRVQRPGSFLADRVGGTAGQLLGAGATAAGRGYLRALAGRASFDTDRLTVTRYESMPATEYAACYRTSTPGGIHPVYDEAFCEWRFSEPDNSFDGYYLAHWDGHPVAGLVASRSHDERNDTTTVTLGHVVPLSGGPERTAGIAAIFERLFADYRDADLVRTWNPLFPDAVLSAYGFSPDDRLPVSAITEPGDLNVGVRPVDLDDWSVGGIPIFSAVPYLWSLA